MHMYQSDEQTGSYASRSRTTLALVPMSLMGLMMLASPAAFAAPGGGASVIREDLTCFLNAGNPLVGIQRRDSLLG
jgi:hypothetical protein